MCFKKLRIPEKCVCNLKLSAIPDFSLPKYFPLLTVMIKCYHRCTCFCVDYYDFICIFKCKLQHLKAVMTKTVPVSETNCSTITPANNFH